MARIRKVEIRNFRSVRALDWFPGPGVNCLIGPGDSGKSTILDAIDFCLGARRTAAISDTDFHNLDVGQAISITLTLGALPDALQNLDTYGDFLRSYHAGTRVIEEEPQHGWETVLSVNVLVGADLEPVWTLISSQAQAAGIERGLRWADRVSIAPARLGNYLNAHLGWTRGSVGFYPEVTDGCERSENFWSCLAVLRRILGLWNRSMYSNTSALAASSVE